MENISEIKNLMNRMGQIGIVPNDIIENENKVIRLVEERGVAASPYTQAIKTICDFVENYCHTMQIDEEKTIIIPFELTEKIDFIKDLTIEVTITNSNSLSVLTVSGGGSSNLKPYEDEIIDNKLSEALIKIHCYAYRGYFAKYTFYNSLYHEINHCYDAYQDLKKNGYYKRFIGQVKKSNIKVDDIFDDYTDNELFRRILYRLFSETEFNALISSVYGDLDGFDSKREDFKQHIKLTQAYNFYDLISKNYMSLYKKINDKNINKVKQLLENHGIHLNPYGNSTESYVKELSRKTNFLLKQLFKQIGKVASLYYDNKETTVPPEIMTIN